MKIVIVGIEMGDEGCHCCDPIHCKEVSGEMQAVSWIIFLLQTIMVYIGTHSSKT